MTLTAYVGESMRRKLATRLSILLAAATLAAMPVTVTAQERDPTPEEKAVLTRADEALKRKDYVALRAILSEPGLANYARAHQILGQLHNQGLGGPKDPEAGRAEYRRAAELGDVRTMLSLAEELEREGTPASRAEAKSWFTSAGNSAFSFYAGHARSHLGRMAWNDGDFPGAVNYWSRAGSDPFARACLGAAYALGKGTAADPLKASYEFYKIAGQGPSEGLPCMEWAAAAGNVHAQFALGTVYGDAKSKAFNAAKAFDWYRKAASGGHGRAALMLAQKLDKGDGVPRNAAEAYRHYALAANNASLDNYDREKAFVRMGEMALAGDGVAKNVAEAVRFLSKSEYGNHNYQLGLIYAGAEGWPRDMAKAVDVMGKVFEEKEPQANAWLKQQADAGNALAQYTYASEIRYDSAPDKDAAGRELTYEQRKAIEQKTYAQAQDYYRRAARQNLPQAMFKVADSGTDLPAAERLRLMRAAADRGYVPAMLEMARWSFLGWHGLAKDPAMERTWLDRAAATGNADAMMSAGGTYHTRGAIGTNYMSGNPAKIAEVQQYYRLAASYYERAHAAGSKSAADSLVDIYDNTSIPGVGNPQLEFKWRKIAVERKPDEKGMTALSKLYETGRGTPVDLMRAWFWGKSAMRYGTSKDAARVDALWNRLTAAQRATAQRAVMTCEMTSYQTCTI